MTYIHVIIHSFVAQNGIAAIIIIILIIIILIIIIIIIIFVIITSGTFTIIVIGAFVIGSDVFCIIEFRKIVVEGQGEWDFVSISENDVVDALGC